MQTAASDLATRNRDALLRRNAVFDAYFRREAPRLAVACRELSRRFLAGGRLFAFGQGAAATDAQHVSVEFVHPIIVGKRALPGLDLSADVERRLPVLLRADDVAMGFAFPMRDSTVERALHLARERGAITFGLADDTADYAFSLPDADPFVCQEVFEHLYHVLWETVHVFLEHREQGHDVGATGFLYPFLGRAEQGLDQVVEEVQTSLLQKLAEVNSMRTRLADAGASAIAEAAAAIAERLEAGGKLLIFGNGGSATDANDFAIDCVTPPDGTAPVPALSLAAEPAILTAVANDIGTDVIFARQVIAYGDAADVAVGVSTSGGSPNILAALTEARKRGMLTVALVGYDSGRIVSEGLADHAIVVPSDYVPRIQEVQASAYHVLRRNLGELQKSSWAPGRRDAGQQSESRAGRLAGTSVTVPRPSTAVRARLADQQRKLRWHGRAKRRHPVPDNTTRMTSTPSRSRCERLQDGGLIRTAVRTTRRQLHRTDGRKLAGFRLLAGRHDCDGRYGADAQLLGAAGHMLLVHVVDAQLGAFGGRDLRHQLDGPIAGCASRAEDIDLPSRGSLSRLLLQRCTSNFRLPQQAQADVLTFHGDRQHAESRQTLLIEPPAAPQVEAAAVAPNSARQLGASTHQRSMETPPYVDESSEDDMTRVPRAKMPAGTVIPRAALV